MHKIIVILIFLSSFLDILSAQTSQRNTPCYIIYKLENPIGIENCKIRDSLSSKIYDVIDYFNDRGIKRKLVTNLKINKSGSPEYFIATGFSSRFVSVNVNMQFLSSINKEVFPVLKFLPVTLQQLLINYWKGNNQPEIIYSLPDSSQIKILKEGYDSLHFSGNTIVLERLKISGLIWGNEFAWITKNQELVFVSTNDTEGDKTEIINKKYEPLFNQMLAISTVFSIEAVTKKYPTAIKKQADIVIVNGNLVNVVGKDSIITNAMIVIKEGIINYVGKLDSSKIAPNSFVINGQGKYVLPGLWDMHAHLMQAEWLPKYIMQGVTTVRDCGNELDFINSLQVAVAKNKIMGPTIIKAGLIDGSNKNALGIMQAKTKKDALALVNRYKENGFEQIKIYTSVKYSILKIICKEAHKLGMTVTGHLPFGYTAKANINAGMDMVSHISHFQNTIELKNHQLDCSNKRTRNFIKLLLTKKIVLDPTLSIYLNSDKTYLENIPYYKIVTNQLRQKGVPIIAGTDMSPGGITDELAMYVNAGFTAFQAIQSATIIPAQVMKMDKVTGSIEEGKKADIILIDGNPLQNIGNIKNVKTVIKDNSVFEFE